jgi:GDP-4-dehydro-6-deoxy-D-mannose reductase
VALIEAGRQKPVISVGNLSAVRDFLDVRDVVRAYHLLLEKGKPGIPYNVSSGKKWRIAAILDLLLRLATVKIRVEKDPLRTRPADIPLQCGDPGRLRRATGWRPRYRLEETLENLLEHWRGEVGGGKRKDGKRK